ncbi:MAG: hypothetical protein II553_05785, partial [Lachnospiraceae bacterium]|nr:hypothetical protein [Lachnospiraceae bacterium]
MKDQFRVDRYEMQLLRIRYLSVGMTLYALAALGLRIPMKDRMWMLFGGLFLTILLFWILSGMVGNTVGKKSKYGKEMTFLPIGVGILIALIVAEYLKHTELVWMESLTLILFLAMNVYAIYLTNYVRFVYANRDADYMAVYHVTLGNTRAYRLWYMITVLAVLCVAILPIWHIFDNAWSRILEPKEPTEQVETPPPGSSITDTPEEEEQQQTAKPENPSKDLSWIGVAIKCFLAVMLLLAMIVLAKSMSSRITDAKTSMETDRVIDLKRILVPIQDETVRLRDDNVYDENTYARRIRRTFKRTVFDRYGDREIPELTPTDLLGHTAENREVLLEKY